MADLDFVENAAIWSFAGLLAISASPLAAIAFLTIAPKFVIALRTGDLGGIVTLYVDGIPAAVVDTYSDTVGVVQRILVGDPDLDEHQIYVQKDDDPDTIIEVVRKKLSADEVTPANTRYNPDCDCVQQTPDGGTTWVDAPGLDPRSAPGFRLPPIGGDDPRCHAAANMVYALRQVITADLAFDTVAGLVNDFLGVLILFFPEIGLVIGALFLAAQIILDIGAAAIEAAFTEDVYSAFLCIFYCHIDADGQMSDAELADIYTDVAAQFDSTVQAVFGAHSSTIGAVGWSNAGVSYDQSDDCSGCDCVWRKCWLDGDGLGDWVTPTLLLGKTAGAYNSGDDSIDGTEINAEHNVWANADLEFVGHVKRISIVYDYVNEGGDGSDESSLNVDDGTGGALHQVIYTGGSATGALQEFDLDVDTTYVGIVFTAQVSMKIRKITLTGTGTPPTSGVDCS